MAASGAGDCFVGDGVGRSFAFRLPRSGPLGVAQRCDIAFKHPGELLRIHVGQHLGGAALEESVHVADVAADGERDLGAW